MKKTFFFAQKAFILNDNKLLAIQKSEDDPNQPLKWEVPGGRMKHGEMLIDHIKREIHEETGLYINPGDVFHIWDWVIKRKIDGEDVSWHIVAAAVKCEVLGGEISFEGHEDDDYIGAIEWVAIDNIDNLDWIANMRPVVDKFIESIRE